MDRGHLLFCGAVCLWAGLCFAVPVFLLIFGILYLPFFMAGMIRHQGSPAALWAVALTVLGTAGITGVVRILVLLCRRSERDSQGWLTLSALACGFAAALSYASAIWSQPPSSFAVGLLIVYLPVLCALHLVYLARRPLFSIGRPER